MDKSRFESVGSGNKLSKNELDKIQSKMARDGLQAAMHFLYATHNDEDIITILETELMYLVHSD